MMYKAFISYSLAADGKLASALQSGLQRFTKPWYRLRAIRVFRDETGLALTPELWPDIERALNESEYFLLLASPQAVNSKWVNQEVSHWLSHRSTRTLLIIRTHGELKWDDAASDFDWNQTDALPRQLEKVFVNEPFHLDFRWARDSTDLSLRPAEFLNAIATVAAPLHGKSKDELIGEDVRQFRKTRRVVKGVVATISLLLLISILFGVLAKVAQNRADRSAAEARARLYTSRMNLANQNLLNSHYGGISRLLEETRPARGAKDLRGWEWYYLYGITQMARTHLKEIDEPIRSLAWSVDGRFLAACGAHRVCVWSNSDLALTSIYARDGGPFGAVAWSPDSRLLAITSARSLVFWSPLEKRERATFKTPDEPLFPGWRAPEQLAAVCTNHLMTWTLGEEAPRAGDWMGNLTVATWNAMGGVALAHQGRSGTPHADHDYPPYISLDPPPATKDLDAAPVTDDADPAAEDLDGQLEAEVTALAYGSASNLLAIADTTGKIALVKVSGGGDRLTLPGHVGRIHALALSPDGSDLASADDNGTIRLWNLKNAQLTGTLSGHLGPVATLSWSPNGRFLASGGSDGVKIWDPKLTLEAISRTTISDFGVEREQDTSTGTASSATWSPDSLHVLTVSEFLDMDNTPKNRTMIFDMAGNETVVDADWEVDVTWSSNGKQFISSEDPSRSIRSTETGEPELTLTNATNITVVEWCARSNMIATAGPGVAIAIWDATTGRKLRTTTNAANPDLALRWGPVGAWLAWLSNDKRELNVWDITSETTPRVFEMGQVASWYDWSPSGRFIAVRGSGENITVWDTARGHKKCEISVLKDTGTGWVDWTPGRDLLRSNNKGTAVFKFWDPLRGEEVSEVGAPSGWSLFSRLSPKGTLCASGRSSDGVIRLLPVRGSTQDAHDLIGHTGRVTCIDWSPDCTRLASGSLDGTVKIWDLGSGDELMTLQDQRSSPPRTIEWSHDGLKLMELNREGIITIWDASRALNLATGSSKLAEN